jgi:hypothetical protein
MVLWLTEESEHAAARLHLKVKIRLLVTPGDKIDA